MSALPSFSGITASLDFTVATVTMSVGVGLGLTENKQGLIKPQSGARACNSWIVKYLLLLKLEVTPTNFRCREEKAVANDETTVLPTPKFTAACSYLCF